MFIRSILFLLVLFPPISRIESAKLLFVICCDTLSDDIQLSVFNDLKNIRAEGQRISHYTGLPLKEVILAGTDLNAAKFENMIKSLNVQSDDVLFFYFSGHGYRTALKGENPWPNLFFSPDWSGVDFLQVIEVLKQKSARLLISIADCCNNLLSEHHAPPVCPIKSKNKHEKKMSKGYKKLFLETEGLILITSSEVEEFSWCISEGALYTLAFLENLKIEVKSRSPSWNALLKRSSIKVREFQHPYYLLDIRSKIKKPALNDGL